LYKSIQELDQKEVFDQKEDELEEQISEQTMDESNVKSPRAEIQTSTHRIAKYTSDGKVVITQN
jgi:hypothetical protein